MAFLRGDEREPTWEEWLAKHRSALAATFVPGEIWCDELRWKTFLQNAGEDAESAWRIRSLSPEQAQRLMDFVKRQYGVEPYWGCMKQLELYASTSERW